MRSHPNREAPRDELHAERESTGEVAFDLIEARSAAQGSFERVRADMRARLLAIDPPGIERTPGGSTSGAPSPALASPSIGRYTIRGHIGRGGMGDVYLTHDAALDRPLAIKLLRRRAAADADDRARLQREARSMARLSHPNVLTVYEIGEHDGQVFIALEYVKGRSLTQWLRGGRSWKEVLAVLIAAGEGLAAAHAAGVVHRDFKPDNVLVGDDGRVRVADFGLAWSSGAPTMSAERTLPAAEAPDASFVTGAGVILGTLAYMAPEQYRGMTPTDAADQFSFCLTLYHALYGHLPYDASSPTLYHARVLSEEFRPTASRTGVPGWLRAAALRGLRADPGARWTSMAQLLQVLRRGPRGRRRLQGLALSATIGCGAVGAWTLSGADPAAEACRSLDAPLAGVWDPASRERLASSLRPASAPDDASAARGWRTIEGVLDRYADRWEIERAKTCLPASTDADGTRERRLECLTDAKEQLAAVIDQIDGSAPSALEAAAVAVTELPAPELCREGRWSGDASPVDDPRARRRWTTARKLLAQAAADIDLGRLDAARAAIGDVLATAQELGATALQAESWLALGRTQRAEHRTDAARESLERARALVRGAPGHAALELRVLIQLVDVVGVGERDVAGAEALAAAARERSRDLGDPPLLEAYLANNLARVHRAHDRHAEATDGYLKAYTLLRQSLGDAAPETIATRANLGVVMSLQGQPEAIAILEHALEQQLSAIGEHHPRTPSILRNLGNALGRQGDFARAEGAYRRAVELRGQLRGSEIELAADIVSLARALRELRRLDEAGDALRRAEATLQRVGAPASPALAREREALEAALAPGRPPA